MEDIPLYGGNARSDINSKAIKKATPPIKEVIYTSAKLFRALIGVDPFMEIHSSIRSSSANGKGANPRTADLEGKTPSHLVSELALYDVEILALLKVANR
ncbi:hypothetical protein RND71_017328 [Anisodus tanguticus]|uniref:Uncharacterized protein n=1 Tax=Anisodus tanguticus TaxID=243964 RepID=A0AAE1S3I9_9SOLA|nr:hypothetical protein RND71_017328 [Anisodus tanguticus]